MCVGDAHEVSVRSFDARTAFPVLASYSTGGERWGDRSYEEAGGRRNGGANLRKPAELEEGHGPNTATGTTENTTPNITADATRGSQGTAGGLGSRARVVRAALAVAFRILPTTARRSAGTSVLR